MAQNLIQTIITDEQIAEASAALDVLERIFPDFIVLDVADRRSIRRMGTRSEQFCRQTLIVGKENPKLVPETVGLDDAIADMAAYDRLFPMFSRLTRIHQRWEDTLLAMGSDAFDAAPGRLPAAEGLRQEHGPGRTAQGRGVAVLQDATQAEGRAAGRMTARTGR